MSRLRCPGRVDHLGRSTANPLAPRCGSKNLEVLARLGNRSAFSGYRWTPSRWSEVRCRDCRNRWRTDASVDHLPDGDGTLA